MEKINLGEKIGEVEITILNEEKYKRLQQIKSTCLDLTSLYPSILLKMKDEDIIKMNIDLTEYDPRSQIRKDLGIKD